MERVVEVTDGGEQEVTVEVLPDTVTDIVYLSDYPHIDSEHSCDTEYEIGSVDTTKFPISDFVLDESGTIVRILTADEESEPIGKVTNSALGDVETNDYTCNACSMVFCSDALLAKHVRDEHTIFTCLVCKIECAGSKFHRTHMRQHELRCEYLCSTCKTGFQSDDELMQHMKSHGALLLYACNICDEAFSKMPQLSNHLKTTHPKS